ncbi:hypothetical protein ACQKF3_11085, partial [Staphylococcus capitis]
MSAIIEAKKQQVDTIAEQLKNSVSTVIVDYRGLTLILQITVYLLRVIGVVQS